MSFRAMRTSRAASKDRRAELSLPCTAIPKSVARVTLALTPTLALRNFPCQAIGDEMVRIACCLATERGVNVVVPVNDALMIEDPADAIREILARTQEAMAEASAIVLDGFRLQASLAILDAANALKAEELARPRRRESRPRWNIIGLLIFSAVDPLAACGLFDMIWI